MNERQKKFQFYRNAFISFAAKLFPSILFLAFLAFSSAAQNPIKPESSTAANLNSSPAVSSETEKSEAEEFAPPLIAEDLIHLGDMLEIDVIGSLEYDWRGRADDDGFLSSLPALTVSIPALCRTEKELALEIAEAYKKFMRNPQIVVRVVDRSARQPAILQGAVRLPQRFLIQRPVRLNELVVITGGITDRASGEVSVFRPAQYSCVAHNRRQLESERLSIRLSDLMSGKPEANLYVRAGDLITVEEAAPVYVTGGVVAPQRILFRTGLSLSRAIASAGGLSLNGEASKITIFRRQPNSAQLEIITADLEKITRKQAEDIFLQPHDIIEIAVRGRLSNKQPPIVNNLENSQINNNLPLRVIN